MIRAYAYTAAAALVLAYLAHITRDTLAFAFGTGAF